MKNRFVWFVIGLLLAQAAFLTFLRGSPELKLERSYTATPTITPLPLPPTAAAPTRIPTLIPATMVAPVQPAVASSTQPAPASTLATPTGPPPSQAATPTP